MSPRSSPTGAPAPPSSVGAPRAGHGPEHPELARAIARHTERIGQHFGADSVSFWGLDGDTPQALGSAGATLAPVAVPPSVLRCLHTGRWVVDGREAAAPLRGTGATLLGAVHVHAQGLGLWRRGRRRELAALAEQAGAGLDVALNKIAGEQEVDQAKAVFLATTTHELKTPLTVVKGFVETLRSQPDLDPRERAQALDVIAHRTDELIGIVERILLTSRIEAGGLEVALGEVAPAALLRDRVPVLAAALGHPVELAVADDTPVVTADPEAVATIVEHLLDNAAKFSDPSAAITVRTEAGESWVAIHVHDRGVGMTAEQASRAFDRFWQADGSATRRAGGSGLGLHLCRAYAEAMGAQLTVDTAPGQGSTFSLILPRANSASPDASASGHGWAAEPSVIREFMRQIGVPAHGRTAAAAGGRTGVRGTPRRRSPSHGRNP